MLAPGYLTLVTLKSDGYRLSYLSVRQQRHRAKFGYAHQ